MKNKGKCFGGPRDGEIVEAEGDVFYVPLGECGPEAFKIERYLLKKPWKASDTGGYETWHEWHFDGDCDE